jgi:hypothetical protein
MIDVQIQNVPQVVEKQKQVITVSQILADLNAGLDRKAIREKYNLSVEETKLIFQHPKLSGKRVKRSKIVKFTLVDDTEEQAPISESTDPGDNEDDDEQDTAPWDSYSVNS